MAASQSNSMGPGRGLINVADEKHEDKRDPDKQAYDYLPGVNDNHIAPMASNQWPTDGENRPGITGETPVEF